MEFEFLIFFRNLMQIIDPWKLENKFSLKFYNAKQEKYL